MPERTPRTALISPDPSFRSLITRCLDESGSPVEWVLRAESDVAELRPESVDRLAERAPELLFLDVGSSPSAGVRFVTALTARLPGVTVVAAGGGLEVDELLELIRAGASGYLRRPWSQEEVRGVCANALRKLPAAQPETVVVEHPGASHVIALFAPKGGTGVSTLAANLAVHIRRVTSKRTLLVDLSPELGTCALLLGAEPRYSYLDVIESLQRMDERLLYSFLEEHESGARVLSSPSDPSMVRAITPESLTAMFRLMRRYFEYVVVDLGRPTVDDAVATTLELADERLLLTTADLPTLRNVKQILPHMPRGEDPKATVRLVVNRYEEGVSVPTKDIEHAVGLPIYQVLEEDRERVGRSVNLGRPLVMSGSSPYARAVGKLGGRLAADDVPTNGRKSPLGGLLRSFLPPFARTPGGNESTNGHGEGESSRHATADARHVIANGRPKPVSPRPASGNHRSERDIAAPLTAPRTIQDGI